MKTLSKALAMLFIFAGILGFCGAVAAHDKVVVIPLGDEAYQDPTNGFRTLHFDAHSIGGGPPISNRGLVFSDTHESFTCCATLNMKRPADWDGVSPIIVELFTQGIGTGTDSFFVKAIDYNDGDQRVDTQGVQTDVREYTQASQFRVFTTVFPAVSLQKTWWELYIQRATSTGTNTDEITLISVAVSYTALQ